MAAALALGNHVPAPGTGAFQTEAAVPVVALADLIEFDEPKALENQIVIFVELDGDAVNADDVLGQHHLQTGGGIGQQAGVGDGVVGVVVAHVARGEAGGVPVCQLQPVVGEGNAPVALFMGILQVAAGEQGIVAVIKGDDFLRGNTQRVGIDHLHMAVFVGIAVAAGHQFHDVDGFCAGVIGAGGLVQPPQMMPPALGIQLVEPGATCHELAVKAAVLVAVVVANRAADRSVHLCDAQPLAAPWIFTLNRAAGLVEIEAQQLLTVGGKLDGHGVDLVVLHAAIFVQKILRGRVEVEILGPVDLVIRALIEQGAVHVGVGIVSVQRLIARGVLQLKDIEPTTRTGGEGTQLIVARAAA